MLVTAVKDFPFANILVSASFNIDSQGRSLSEMYTNYASIYKLHSLPLTINLNKLTLRIMKMKVQLEIY